MSALSGTRVDIWVIHFNVAGTFLGTWDTADGFEVDSEESKYRPGGVDREISLGGRKSFSNITVSRYWDDWVSSIYPWLEACAGQQRCYVARYPFTANWVQVGRAITRSGTLKRVAAPDVDSMGSDAALVECEMTVDGL